MLKKEMCFTKTLQDFLKQVDNHFVFRVEIACINKTIFLDKNIKKKYKMQNERKKERKKERERKNWMFSKEVYSR